MATQVLVPDAIAASTNLTGAVTDIDETPIYDPQGVVFDGTNDWLTRGGAYTGLAADTKLLTAAFAVKFPGATADMHILSGQRTAGSSNPGYVVGRHSTSGGIYMFGQSSAGATVLSIRSPDSLADNNWHMVLCSVDLANTANRWIYIDDIQTTLTITTYTDTAIDVTDNNHLVGAQMNADNTTTANKLNGELSDLWFDIGRYVDWSVTANRRLFFTSDNKIVYKGEDGSLPFSAVPTLFLMGPTASWHTNRGGGGGLTLTGALVDSGTSPTGAP